MLRRLYWLTVGTVLGAAGTLWDGGGAPTPVARTSSVTGWMAPLGSPARTVETRSAASAATAVRYARRGEHMGDRQSAQAEVVGPPARVGGIERRFAAFEPLLARHGGHEDPTLGGQNW